MSDAGQHGQAEGGLDRRAGEGAAFERRNTALAGQALRDRAQAIEAAGIHRRHEELLETAGSDGIDAAFAEQIHDLAEEEGLAPAYALALVASGIGVEELVEPESGDDESLQQSPPDWVVSAETNPAAITRERRLRMSIRRLRGHLEREGSAVRAVEGFLAEPDVGHISY
ncbi:MAG: hypothetical protein ABIV28_00690 [Longimicrobiales bacterium]